MESNRLDVPSAEYEERRHVFDLCRWINSKLGVMESLGNFDEAFLERKGLNVKKLIEEAIPVSRLALFLSAPANEVYVTLRSGNQPFDAEIEIAGFGARSFRVEVTTTESDSSTLRRQALSRYGKVNLHGPISRRGFEIESSDEMVDVSAEEERCIALMFERLRRKVESGRYGPDTAVLVHCSEYLRISLEARATLVKRTQRYLLEQTQQIPAAYFGYAIGLCVDEALAG